MHNFFSAFNLRFAVFSAMMKHLKVNKSLIVCKLKG